MLKKGAIKHLQVKPGKKVRLWEYPTDWAETEVASALEQTQSKKLAEKSLQDSLKRLATAQEVLYADNRYGLLVIFQAMDAGGKDGMIKHVMSGVNPQGCQVFAFKQPTPEELDHNFLWRYSRCLPERGRIGIFNRSYYEDVLVVKVHPERLGRQTQASGKIGKAFWTARYDDINNFERHLVRNGIVVLKFYLHISKEEQKRRFLDRLSESEKHWKFSIADLTERTRWSEYMDAYEEALAATSTKWAPWYIVPADRKWAARALVAALIARTLMSMDLEFPKMTDDERVALAQARQALEREPPEN
jgi:PPK2 family polyphosphate:nucleotide phosphotransferase